VHRTFAGTRHTAYPVYMENWHDPDYDTIATLYTAEFGIAEPDDPDAAFLLALIGDTRGPVLDLGCGTGRLLVPLAADGLRVTGVDTSAGMLAQAHAAAEAMDIRDRVTLLLDDFRTLAALSAHSAALPFTFAYCAQNTFLHLPDNAAQVESLKAIAARLRPGARLLLDLIHPNPDLLARYYGTLTHEATFADNEGNRVDRFVTALYHATTQTVDAIWFYDRTEAGGALSRVVVPFTMRLIGRYELELVLAAAGFALEDIYSDTDFAPLHDNADRMLVVAVKR